MEIQVSRPNRFSSEQIHCGLRMVLTECLGCEPAFSPETAFVEFLKAERILDDVDFADVIDRLEEFFGFHCPTAEWTAFVGPTENIEVWTREYAPNLTFQSLAEFIAERVDGVSMHPVSLLGRPCAAAGTFLGLEQLARQIVPNVEPFAPSTRIFDRLRGPELWQFWEKLLWISQGRLPATRYHQLNTLLLNTVA